jgi:hypothetical protein
MSVPGVAGRAAPDYANASPGQSQTTMTQQMVPVAPIGNQSELYQNQTTSQQSASPSSSITGQNDNTSGVSIEKEYISKAKAIIEQTKADPHAQVNELSKVKAAFLKKRYGKDMKLGEG